MSAGHLLASSMTVRSGRPSVTLARTVSTGTLSASRILSTTHSVASSSASRRAASAARYALRAHGVKDVNATAGRSMMLSTRIVTPGGKGRSRGSSAAQPACSFPVVAIRIFMSASLLTDYFYACRGEGLLERFPFQPRSGSRHDLGRPLGLGPDDRLHDFDADHDGHPQPHDDGEIPRRRQDDAEGVADRRQLYQGPGQGQSARDGDKQPLVGRGLEDAEPERPEVDGED